MLRNPYKDEDPKNRAGQLHARYDGLRKIPMSSWYSIFDLFHTAMDISLSEVFRSRFDRRMLQPPEPQSSPVPTATLEPTDAASQAQSTRPKSYFDYSTPQEEHRLRNGEFWFDFAADVGDGFNSTYYVASLLAQPELVPLKSDPQPQAGTKRAAQTDERADAEFDTQAGAKPAAPPPPTALPRGEFLILGGDEVYPSASRENYEQRFCRVYEAAAYADRPPSPDTAKHLYAIPGNHDWYDGLASFMQVFGDERAIGQFRTRQRSSYFAIKLPHGLWIFAIDIGLWGELDRRQVEYFQDLAENELVDGDRIILCIAEPDWVKARPNIDNLRDGLFYFERRLAEALERGAQRDAAAPPPSVPTPADPGPVLPAAGRQSEGGSARKPRRDVRVILRLAGDLHHYRRHQSLEPWHPTDRNVQNQDFVPHGHRWVQNITAGGGGAFLHPTHEVDADRRSTLGGALKKAGEGTVTQFPPGFYKIRDAAKQDEPINETREDCLVFACKKAFPTAEESRRLTRKNLWFFAPNFDFLLSLILLYGALLNLGLYLFHIQHHMWSALLLILVGLGFLKGCQGYARSEASGEIGESKQGRQRQIYRRRAILTKAGNRGLAHGFAHALVFAGSLAGLAIVYQHFFRPPTGHDLSITHRVEGCMPILTDLNRLWDQHPSWPRWPVWFWLLDKSCTADFASVVRFVLAAGFGVACALVSTMVFGIYLFLALNKSALRLHANGAFAALRIQDYKNFLRIRVTADGVTVYPIGIRTVPKKWDLRIPNEPGASVPPGPPQTSLFYPEGSDRSRPFYDQLTQTEKGTAPFLIEGPLFIPRDDAHARPAPTPTSTSTSIRR